jgi:hypothetical protein
MYSTYAVTVDVKHDHGTKTTYFRDTLAEVTNIVNEALLKDSNVNIIIDKMSANVEKVFTEDYQVIRR